LEDDDLEGAIQHIIQNNQAGERAAQEETLRAQLAKGEITEAQ
jgi:hypothetical protein